MTFQHTFSYIDARSSAVSNAGRDYNVLASNKEQILQKLHPVLVDPSLRSGCLPGTRQDIIQSIIEWAMSSSEQGVYWLYGPAGSGKSAVATTVANSLRKAEHLGAFFNFSRDIVERSHPAAVIRTMAYQLATFDQRIGTAIAAVMEAIPTIAHSPLISQFSILLAQPLSSVDALRSEAPLVIVLDALDECGTADERSSIVAVLAEASANLPSTVRIVVTSRPESDIVLAFRSQPHIIARELDITTPDNSDDIRSYLQHRMAGIRTRSMHLHLEANWPGESVINELVKQASGLFIWASLVSAFIDGYDPSKRVAVILSGQTYSGLELALDGLYKTALEPIGQWDAEDFAADFKSILGAVIVAKVPLSASTIGRLLSTPDDRPVAYTYLGSVLSTSAKVQILHPSFADFLTDRKRCGRDVWFIDRPSGNLRFGIACLRRLDEVLKYNICDMTLPTREVNANLSEDITYACSFWIDHVVVVTGNNPSLEDILNTFLHKHLLHWFELMSILNKTRETISSLNRLLHWATEYCDKHCDLILLIRDAMRFAQAFADSFEEHPLLVYLAALPFTPIESRLYQTFHDNHRDPLIPDGFHKSWPDLLCVLTGHDDLVSSVAFSPDGRHIASASRDMTIRVWDAMSGMEVLQPLEGHEKWVTSVAYCPDGSRIVSGSRDMTVRIWDATSGMEVLLPLSGHKAGIASVAYSSDGSRIASGSWDSTVRVWDAIGGGEVLCLLCGHNAGIMSVVFSPDGVRIASASEDKTVCLWDAIAGTRILALHHHAAVMSANFSPDGKHIVSGSEDRTVRVWDTYSGAQALPLLRGHEAGVTWVGYSPDGTRIISCSGDKSIRIWDSCLGTEMFHPLHVHEAGFIALALSPNGRCIVSGSSDATIRIWDADPKGITLPSLGHEGSVTAVAFSINGEHVASGADDRTILVWDAKSGRPVFLPMRGHSAGITSITFAPDGTRIASASYDKTIRIWDLEAGLQVLPPLRGHRTWIRSLAFSPDGTRIVSSSYGRSIRVWDAVQGTQLLELLQGPEAWIMSLAFSHNGKEILSVSHDNTVCTWDATTGIFTSKIDQSILTHCLKKPQITPSLNGWMVESETHRHIVKLPSIIAVQSVVSAASGNSIAIGTSGGRLLIIHIPSSIIL